MRQLYVLTDLSPFYCNILSVVIKPIGTITMFNIEHVILGFRRGISEVFARLVYCAASIGSYGHFGVPEGGTYRISRNVGNLTPTLRNIPQKRRQHLTLTPNLGVHREEYFNQTYVFFLSLQKTKCAVQGDTE
jgi:hypothetical protein